MPAQDKNPGLVNGVFVTLDPLVDLELRSGFSFRQGLWLADLRPDLLAKGEDPQLDKAVLYLLDQLKKNPPKPIADPAYPKTKVGGG